MTVNSEPSLACLFARFLWQPKAGDRVMYVDSEINRESVITSVGAPYVIDVGGKESLRQDIWLKDDDREYQRCHQRNDLYFMPTQERYFELLKMTEYMYDIGLKDDPEPKLYMWVPVPKQGGFTNRILVAPTFEDLLSALLEVGKLSPYVNDKINEIVLKCRNANAERPVTG